MKRLLTICILSIVLTLTGVFGYLAKSVTDEVVVIESVKLT